MTSDDQNDEGNEPTPGRLRQMYEETAKALADANAKAADLEKREVFRGAGLDLSKPLHAALAKAYDGDLATDQVAAYVQSLELGDGNPAPEPPAVPDSEREAHQRITNASTGDTPPPPVQGMEAFEADARALMEQAITRGGVQRMTTAQMDQAFVNLAQKHGMPTTWDAGRDNAR